MAKKYVVTAKGKKLDMAQLKANSKSTPILNKRPKSTIEKPKQTVIVSTPKMNATYPVSLPVSEQTAINENDTSLQYTIKKVKGETKMDMNQNPINPVISVEGIIPLKNDVLVYDMYFGDRVTEAGLIVINDDKQERGIRPRWAKVYAVGPKNKDIKPEQWILIEHGRWSRGIDLEKQNITIRRVDPKAILMVTNVDPEANKA